MARRALVFNLNPDPTDGEESASFANRGLDDNWADAEPDSRRALAAHASVAAADDSRLLARQLRTLGYAVSCPLIPRTPADMAEIIRSTKRDALRHGMASSDAAAAVTDDEEPCVLVFIAGGYYDDESEDGVVRFLLPDDATAHGVVTTSAGATPPTVIDVTTVRGWLEEELHALPGDNNPLAPSATQVPSLLVADLASTSSSAFRAHVEDRAATASDANRTCHVLSAVHFVMYSSGESLLSLVAISFAACLAGSTLTVAGLAKDVNRRAERLSHFAGPVFDGIPDKPLTITHSSNTPSQPGSPGGQMQQRPHERFDVIITFRVKQPQDARVIDDLAESVLRVSGMQTVRVTSVEWEITARLDTESADEASVRQEAARHLAMVWQCTEAAAQDDIVVMVNDSYREGTLIAKHKDSRPAKLFVRQLVRSEDPCIGPFAVFSAAVAAEVGVRASCHGLIALFTAVRQSQFGHALGLDPVSASLMWSPASNGESGHDLLSRPGSAVRVRPSSASPVVPRPGSSETAPLVPGSNGGEQQIIVVPLIQRLGRGFLARREELWKLSGVPRDVGLMRVAILAARVDSRQRRLLMADIDDADDDGNNSGDDKVPAANRMACVAWLLQQCLLSQTGLWVPFAFFAQALTLVLTLLVCVCLAHVLEALRLPQGPGPSPLLVLVSRVVCAAALLVIADMWQRLACGVLSARGSEEFEKGLARSTGRLKRPWRQGVLGPIALSQASLHLLQAAGHMQWLLSSAVGTIVSAAVGAALIAESGFDASRGWEAYATLYVLAIVVFVVAVLGAQQPWAVALASAACASAWLLVWLDVGCVGLVAVFALLVAYEAATFASHCVALSHTAKAASLAVEMLRIRREESRAAASARIAVTSAYHHPSAVPPAGGGGAETQRIEHSSSGTSELMAANGPMLDYRLASSRMSLARRISTVVTILVVFLVGGGFVATPLALYSARGFTCPRTVVYCSAVSNTTGTVLVSRHALESDRAPTWTEGCSVPKHYESWLPYCDNLMLLAPPWQPALLGSTTTNPDMGSGFEPATGVVIQPDSVWSVAVVA